MIDKATFEAHVRAEAERRWPMPDDEPDHTSMDRQSTYIATRMEHEWPLVDALNDIATNYDHDSDAHKYGTTCRMCSAQAALSPYTTKPIEP